MKNKKVKRLLAVVMAGAMTLSMCITPALATDISEDTEVTEEITDEADADEAEADEAETEEAVTDEAETEEAEAEEAETDEVGIVLLVTGGVR